LRQQASRIAGSGWHHNTDMDAGTCKWCMAYVSLGKTRHNK